MGEYYFTNDWFSKHIQKWDELFTAFALKHKENLTFLEIGSYQGRSAIWLLENVLTHPTSKIHCIDTFEGSVEHSSDEKSGLYEIFTKNMERHKEKVEVYVGTSFEVLKSFKGKEIYDCIHIDGDHTASSVLEDAVLSFPLLKKGGIMIFDDYLWFGMPDVVDCPKIAIDAFMQIYSKHLRYIYVDYQIMLLKV